MAEGDSRSFWGTLPGILTAAGALITAVAGLLVTLHQLGVIGGDRIDKEQPVAMPEGPSGPGTQELGLVDQAAHESERAPPSPEHVGSLREPAWLAWPALISDGFDYDSKRWRVGAFQNSFSTGDRRIIEGRYRWRVDPLPTTIYPYVRSTVVSAEQSDFYASAEVRLVEGSRSASDYGLFVRKKGDDFYAFRVQDDQRWRFLLYADREWTRLDGATEADAIRPGEYNRVAIQAVSANFDLFINDRHVGRVVDGHIPDGRLGLIVATSSATGAVTVEFDRFVLRTKPEAAS